MHYSSENTRCLLAAFYSSLLRLLNIMVKNEYPRVLCRTQKVHPSIFFLFFFFTWVCSACLDANFAVYSQCDCCLIATLLSSTAPHCARWQASYNRNPIRPILCDPAQSTQPPPDADNHRWHTPQMSHTLAVHFVTDMAMDTFTLTTSCELDTHIEGWVGWGGVG